MTQTEFVSALPTRPQKGELITHSEKGPYGTDLTRVDFLIGPVENFTLSSMQASGGGALPFAMTGVQPISISSNSTNYHRTFVPNPFGTQVALTLDA